MRRIPTLCLFMLCLAACLPIKFSITTFPMEGQASRTITPHATFTPIPSFTPAPISNKTPEPAGSIVLDFASQLCNASWSNGAQALQTCPDASADHSGGYAALLDPTTEGLPAATPVLLTIPGWKGSSALFLRYPAMTVRANDRFRVVLLCRQSIPCDVQFSLEYYDSGGSYHGSFLTWDYKTGDASITVDADLTPLAGQLVEFVLALRISHSLDNPNEDNGLWIAPQIFRPTP